VTRGRGLVLGIESSCDETAAAVVERGRRVLSNRIASQVPLHQRWGGVVPEIASRAHLEAIVPIVEGALADAGVGLADLDAIAITRGPGLIGSLLVGVEFARALATTRAIPLVPVQHVAGHIWSVFLGRHHDAWGHDVAVPADTAPYVALVISGGHSSLVRVDGPTAITILGETLDDAVGEAYDKVAKLLGLDYPGGPLVDRLAATGNPEAIALPRPLLNKPGLDFSFSGLKTAVAREVEKAGGAAAIRSQPGRLEDFCAAFQAACIDVLLARARRALEEQRLERLAIVGGVACNRGLRAAIAPLARRHAVAIPEPEYCGDNAAMIAGLGWQILSQKGPSPVATTHAAAGLPLEGADGW
jgi:N6-L-threonylcarbamoyladenine synthase